LFESISEWTRGLDPLPRGLGPVLSTSPVLLFQYTRMNDKNSLAFCSYQKPSAFSPNKCQQKPGSAICWYITQSNLLFSFTHNPWFQQCFCAISTCSWFTQEQKAFFMTNCDILKAFIFITNCRCLFTIVLLLSNKQKGVFIRINTADGIIW